MLVLSPPSTTDASDFLETTCGFTINSEDDDEFSKFTDHGDLLDIIDFDDLFDVTGDVLPDLEILSGDFSDHINVTTDADSQGETNNKGISGKGEEVVSKRDDAAAETETTVTCDRKKKNRIHKNEGKRKVKVDWTAELHRRFVEAVEQLGVDKAVPSRILELMGVHCLTRHNVASHLQKYRSHRKHLLAREAEAADWTRKRHIYGVDNTGRNLNGPSKNGWLAPPPTLGFPPLAVPPSPVHFRPLHVWGHPTVDQSHVWPKHLNPQFWVPDSPYWHPIHKGTAPYMPTVATRFRASPVAGIPRAMSPAYKSDHGFGGPRPSLDVHPSKESVDAAIGDVLTRPWLPLPLGLKPPVVEGVMTELHRHGVSEVPPTTPCA